MPADSNPLLGDYLKDRRSRLDPAAFGYPAARRRTPACAAKKSRNAPTSTPPGTRGWNRGAAAQLLPKC